MGEKTYRRRRQRSPGPRRGPQGSWLLRPQSNYHGDHKEDNYHCDCVGNVFENTS